MHADTPNHASTVIAITATVVPHSNTIIACVSATGASAADIPAATTVWAANVKNAMAVARRLNSVADIVSRAPHAPAMPGASVPNENVTSRDGLSGHKLGQRADTRGS